jgi:hypothetical protein
MTLLGVVLTLLAGSAASGGCASARSAASSTIDLPPSAWAADLEVLARELPRRHMNAFHTVSQQEFADAVHRLRLSLPTMSHEEAYVGLRQLTAMIGDGHTALSMPSDWPWLPYRFRWFGDLAGDPGQLELRVIAARGPFADALGARVVQIGDVPVEEAYESISTLVAQGESPGSSRLAASVLLLRPPLLRGLGLSASAQSVRFTFEDSEGRQFERWASPSTSREWARAAPQAPIHGSRPGDGFWFNRLDVPEENGPLVYLAFNEYPGYISFWRRSGELLAYLDREDARKLVIDLRDNTGGDFNKARRLLIPRLRKRPNIEVYVLIGPRTFSAAMVNALDFRDRLGAVLVGEPTGARPNQYQEGRSFTLPNSGLRVSYSVRYYRFQEEDTPGVLPDHSVATGFDDYIDGRDPALEWVLAQPQRRSVSP